LRQLTCALVLAPALLVAQGPRIGIIEFYGARKTPAAELRKALAIREGAELPGSRAAIEERLVALRNVRAARVSAACCDAGRVILYVGVEESDAPAAEVRLPPETELYVPTEVADAYQSFLDAANAAARRGTVREDLSQGHSLASDDAVRRVQLRFGGLAEKHAAELRSVLRDAADERQRAIAAYVIGYHPDKARIAEDLLYALEDADPAVRANAMRGLAALVAYASKNPAAGLSVTATPLIDMLNSVEWSDRNNAAVTLATLTESRDRTLLALLRERAMAALVEMAKWRHLPHALPAYIVVGRIAGVSEPELQKAWKEGTRQAIIRRATGASSDVR
jgi:hypothetical protein